jgi:hypothetical protein
LLDLGIPIPTEEGLRIAHEHDLVVNSVDSFSGSANEAPRLQGELVQLIASTCSSR